MTTHAIRLSKPLGAYLTEASRRPRPVTLPRKIDWPKLIDRTTKVLLGVACVLFVLVLWQEVVR